jgi:hypothetical protein
MAIQYAYVEIHSNPTTQWSKSCIERLSFLRLNSTLLRYARLKTIHNMKECERLLSKWKTSRAIDEMKLTGCLAARDGCEQYITRLTGSGRIMAGPHELGRNAYSVAPHRLPKTVFC